MTLDDNGLPVGHVKARDAAIETLRDLVNELPDSAYHLGPTDAQWITDNMLTVYLHHVRRQQ
jgi:hypothetical protein